MTDTPTQPPSKAPGMRVIAGRYEVVGIIGQGGMGQVLKARDRVLDRDVALKQLLTEHSSDAEFLERFSREARALARVRHPGVTQVHDFLPDVAGAAYLVLEFVPGRSLDEELHRLGRLSWLRTARLGIAVCDVLHAAHTAGVIHRDMKPGNIMVEPDGTVRVADFGVARMMDVSATRTGMLMGTPAYMAPEVCRGDGAVPASDMYGLSAVLFEAACGRAPFVSPDGNGTAILAQHLFADVPDPRTLVPDLPDRAADLLMRGLAKDPVDRFATAAEMAALLRECAEDGGLEDLPPRPPRPPLAIPQATEPAPGDPRPGGALTEPAPGLIPTEPGGVVAPAPGPVPVAAGEPVPTPEPAAASLVSSPAPAEVRGGGRRVPRVAVAGAGLLMIGAVAGGVAGSMRDADPPPAREVGLRTMSSAGATVRVPADWSRPGAVPADVTALGLTPAVARTGADGSGVALGLTAGTGARMLPDPFLRRVSGEMPPAETVRVDGASAVRFASLPLTRPDGHRVTVHVVPTRRGALTLACFGPAATFAAHDALCARIAGTLRPASGQAFPLGPDRRYARFLGASLRTLRSERTAAQRAIGTAASRTGQADAARRAAAAYRRLGGTLRGRVVTPQIEPLHSALATAAGRAASAYDAMATAAGDGSEAAWNTARTRALSSDRAFATAVRAMAAGGYPAREA